MTAIRSDLAAALVIVVVFGLQLWGLDYGTSINDVPYVAKYEPRSDVAAGSGLKRNIVVSGGEQSREQPDLWATRFKLYSVEADEIMNIMALARINQHKTAPDPGFYQYGGAWIYPLGAWYFALTKLGLVAISDLGGLLAEPERMDRVWVFGRLLTLISFAASAGLLWLSLRRLAPAGVALLLLGLYVLCPGSILFSQIMKPHWYALVWVNLAFFLLVRTFQERRLTNRAELALGLALGLAVGSAVTFAFFAVVLWGALALLVRGRALNAAVLLRVPAVASIVFILTNPYYFLNWSGYAAEREAAKTWFAPRLSLDVLVSFVDNSLFTSLGVMTTLLLLVVLAARAIRPASKPQRMFALALLGVLLFGAVMTASMQVWHSNIRYVSYALPAGLIFLASSQWRFRAATLVVALVLTFVQALPLKLAYLDENDPAHSTRLGAASWIDQNVPAGDSICVGTISPAPYDTPPFKFGDYVVRPHTDCSWRVLVERETDSTHVIEGDELLQRFRPRLSPERFPLVFGHINPQISIYRVNAAQQAAAQ